MGEYDIAQICVNGHIINAMASRYPSHSQRHCSKCGADAIAQCPACKHSIRGDYYVEGFFGASRYKVPSFCHECGAAYPWTKASLASARELADEIDDLKPAEKEQLKQSIDELVKDTPRTSLAATRFKKLAAKGGKIAVDGFKEILIGVISESAKKMLWP